MNKTLVIVIESKEEFTFRLYNHTSSGSVLLRLLADRNKEIDLFQWDNLEHLSIAMAAATMLPFKLE